MVQENGASGAAQAGLLSTMDQTMAFFDQVFEAVPQSHRIVDREYLDVDAKIAKQAKKGKQKKVAAVSLMELNEKAHERMEEIRRVNAKKSQDKIKQLTVEHQKNKATPKAAKADPDTIMSGDDEPEESKEDRGSKGKKNGKKVVGGKREPLESKDTVAKSKLANKRSQKDAIKKNKIKRNKGTVKEPAAEKTSE